MNKLQQFIFDNKIDLNADSTGSDLNGLCLPVVGYALYLGYDDTLDIVKSIERDDVFSIPNIVVDEIDRIFEYAANNNYGNWWQREEAHETYIFE